MEIDDDDDDDIMEISVFVEDNNDELIDAVRSRRLMSMPVHKHMITHVVWPRQLPSKDNEDSQHETALIALMADTLESFDDADIIPVSTSRLFRGIFNIRSSSDAYTISSEINRLQDGEMFGVFVQQQKCGFSIFIPKSEKLAAQRKTAIVSTFPVWIPNEEIYLEKHSEFQVIVKTKIIKL